MSLAQLIFVNSAAFKRSNSHSTETKKQLIELLAEELLKVYTNTPCEKKLVITSQSECPVQVHLGIKTLRHGMSTTDEEADVITPQQVITAIEEGATCVKFISDDTDVFVLLLHFYIEQLLSTTVFLKGTGNKRNVIVLLTLEKQLRNKKMLYRLCWQLILSADVTACQSCIVFALAAKIPVATFGRSKC